MRFVKVVVMLIVTVFYFRSHFGSIEKMKAVKSSLAASSGAERQQAVRFKNELKAGICGSGVVKRKLTYGECVHRVQWLEKYCVKIKRRHLKQSLVDFLKKQTGIVNTESQKKVTRHLPILLSNASKPPSFPPSSAPEHLVMEIKIDQADAGQSAPKRIRQQKQTDTVQGPRSVTVAYGSVVEMDGVRGVLTPLVLEPATAAISVLTLERVGGTERNLKAPGTLAPSKSGFRIGCIAGSDFGFC